MWRRPSKTGAAGLAFASRRGREGFALIISLSLLALILPLLVLLSSQLRIQISANALNREVVQARQAALLGMAEAVGEVQRHAGPDRRMTSTASGWTLDPAAGASAGRLHWTGVWDATAPGDPPVFLVSGNNDPAAATPNVSLVGEGTLGPAAAPADTVEVESVELPPPNQTDSLSTAFWVGDEGIKAPASLPTGFDDIAEIDEVHLRNRRLQSHYFQPVPGLLITGFDPDAADLERVTTRLDLGYLSDDDTLEPNAFGNRFHQLSSGHRSVLTNLLDGGLKENLTDPGVDAEAILKGDRIVPFDTATNFDPSGRLIAKPVENFIAFQRTLDRDDPPELEHTLAPIVTEVAFKIGPFYTRKDAGGFGPSDGRHRIRFHVEVEFWNPYPFPLYLESDDQRKFRVLLTSTNFGESLNMTVENESTEDAAPTIFTVDLLDFDESHYDNDRNESVIASWIEIPVEVLAPGEVYRVLEPINRDQGLARTIASDADRWTYYSSDPPPESSQIKEQNTIRPNDTIAITLQHPPNGLTMRVIPFVDGPSSLYQDYREYSPRDFGFIEQLPIVEVRGIEYPNQTRRISGDQYARETSGSYTINNYQLGYWFRFVDDSEAARRAFFETIDLRSPIYDMQEEGVEDMIEVESDPWLVALSNSDFDGSDLFHDEVVNSPGTNRPIVLFDAPDGEPVSIGDYRHLQFTHGHRPLALGETFGGDLNELYDRYFVTGVGAEWTLADGLPNPRLTSLELPDDADVETIRDAFREGEVAGSLLLRDTFNLNSLDPEVWEMFLTRRVADWNFAPDNGQFEEWMETLEGVFFSFPFTADLTTDFNDTIRRQADFDAMSSGTTPEEWAIASYQQALRVLEPQQIRVLAEAIVARIEEDWLAVEGRPFANLVEFMDAGILENALEDVGINLIDASDEYPAFSPAYLSQGTIMANVGDHLTSRSDTFLIRSRGDYQREATGVRAVAYLEAEVQRLPERVDEDAAAVMDDAVAGNNPLGRKFRVLSMRWVGEEEI